MQKRVYKTLFFITLFIVLVFAIIPDDHINIDLEYEDKIKHATAFFTLSFLLNRASSTIKHRIRNIFAILSFGIFIEIVQYFIPYRDSSIEDIYADLVGILIFQLSLSLFRIYKNIKI